MKGYFQLACAFLATTIVSGASTTKDWSYRPTSHGIYGPNEWFKATGSSCGGSRQSPIDITQGPTQQTQHIQNTMSSPLTFDGVCDNYNITQQYDAFKYEAIQSTCTVTLDNQNGSYGYVQSHLHFPSEHKINGKQYDGEIHLVHSSEKGYLVIGLFLEETKDDTPTIPLWSNLVAGLSTVTPSTSANLKL